MLKTHIRCSCGKEFINSSELGHAFALANHTVKQLFYTLAAQLHFLAHGHKKLEVYETYESPQEVPGVSVIFKKEEEIIMLKTHIRCSCGKEFVNSSELGHAFVLANHTVKQLFYTLAAQLHFLVHGHKKLAVYETCELSKKKGEMLCDL